MRKLLFAHEKINVQIGYATVQTDQRFCVSLPRLYYLFRLFVRYFNHAATQPVLCSAWSEITKTRFLAKKSNRKAMNRNWSNQKANPALKTKTGNKYYK